MIESNKSDHHCEEKEVTIYFLDQLQMVVHLFNGYIRDDRPSELCPNMSSVDDDDDSVSTSHDSLVTMT